MTQLTFELGDRVFDLITSRMGWVIALTREQDYAPNQYVRVRFDGVFGQKRWIRASLLSHVTAERKGAVTYIYSAGV